MSSNKIPKYFTFRLLLLPMILHAFMVLPLNGLMFAKSAPDFIKKYEGKEKNISDSLHHYSDSVAQSVSNMADSMVAQIEKNANLIDSNANEKKISSKQIKNHSQLSLEINSSHNINIEKEETSGLALTLILLLIAIAGIIFNFPIRRYFKKLRKKKPVSDKLKNYVRKYLLKTPLINMSLFALAFLINHLFSLYLINTSQFPDEIERGIFRNTLIIAFISSVLTVLFVFLWQKHRVQFMYIGHVFSKEELKKSIYKSNNRSMKRRMWLTSLMTTVLPLSIVIYYIIFSVSLVKDIGLTALTQEQAHILIGKFYPIFSEENTKPLLENFINYPYISSIDLIMMFVGITTGIIMAAIYLVFFVNWMYKSITIPVNDLLESMKSTAKGIGKIALVRTNDEMGQLTENFNEMNEQINSYVSEISQMNKNLEKKVEERTAEVVAQKEEIISQRDMILEKNEELQQQKEEIVSQKDEIEKQRKLLEQKNKNITDSIRYALRIQNAILPSEDYLNSLFNDYFILFKPKDIVSGDFYWACEKNGIIYFAAVDCTGHGVPGALMSIVGHNLLNQALREKEITQPGEILNFLSNEIKIILRKKDENFSVHDGMDITLCALDITKRILEFAGIHNPLYMIRNNKLLMYKSDFIPLGDTSEYVFVGYTNNKIELQKNDVIYLFTDGFIDQFGGKKRRKYMSRNFRETLLEIHSLLMHEQKESLLKIFYEWKGANEQTDDVLVMGVRVE